MAEKGITEIGQDFITKESHRLDNAVQTGLERVFGGSKGYNRISKAMEQWQHIGITIQQLAEEARGMVQDRKEKKDGDPQRIIDSVITSLIVRYNKKEKQAAEAGRNR